MLNIVNAYKIFENCSKPILNNINLNIKEGEFYSVIGSNGSGKTTLFKSIMGEVKLDSGEIFKKSHVSIVTQDINKGTIPELTLLENLVLAKISNTPPSLKFYSNKRDIVQQCLMKLNIGLETFIDYPLKSLSGGQRQMIATLMAIESGSKILLFDEHTSALDPKTHKLLMNFTSNSIKEKKLTALMITHNLEDALAYGTHLIMIHQGQIVLTLNQKQKESTTVEDLITLFHQYDDQILRG